MKLLTQCSNKWMNKNEKKAWSLKWIMMRQSWKKMPGKILLKITWIRSLTKGQCRHQNISEMQFRRFFSLSLHKIVCFRHNFQKDFFFHSCCRIPISYSSQWNLVFLFLFIHKRSQMISKNKPCTTICRIETLKLCSKYSKKEN